MRQKFTFILTVFQTEVDSPDFRGQIRAIADESPSPFVTLQELAQIVRSEIRQRQAENQAESDEETSVEDSPGPPS